MNILDYIRIPVASAQTASSTSASAPVRQFVGKVDKLIVNPLIVLMFAVALLYFLYGMFQFLLNADKSEDRETGKNHIFWGLVGMFLMFAVFTILHIIQNTLGGSTIALPIQ